VPLPYFRGMVKFKDLLVADSAICAKCLARQTDSRADIVIQEIERLGLVPNEGHCATCMDVTAVYTVPGDDLIRSEDMPETAAAIRQAALCAVCIARKTRRSPLAVFTALAILGRHVRITEQVAECGDCRASRMTYYILGPAPLERAGHSGRVTE
jgi:hypothetical protein